jgi:hypothetical protein
VKRFIVSTDGEIIDQELHSPFVYLTRLNEDLYSTLPEGGGSITVRFPQFHPGNQDSNRSGDALERFFESIRFEQRDKLSELPVDLDSLDLG